MSVSTTPGDVRIVDLVDDGGTSSTRATWAGAVVGVSMSVALAFVSGDRSTIWLGPFLVFGAAVAATDLATGRLPDRLVALAAASGLMAAPVVGDGGAGLGAWLTGAVALAVPLLAIHLVSPCSMGFGDVKFAASVGGVLGLLGTDLGGRVGDAMAVLTIASAIAAAGAIATRRPSIAFGPALFLVGVGFVTAAANGGWSG